AARFGTTASCNDYPIHWDAPHDACARLAADPAGFLDAHHALGSVRAVLDRRRRQLELIALARALGRTPPAPPPEVSAVVSLACLEVGGAAAGPSGRTVTIDGDPVSLRELHVADVRPTGDGPIDVYRALAALLGGADPALAPPNALAPADLAGDDFPLARLDQLVDADPFRGARWPLDHPELIAVFPFERHLHAFVDAFRRRYLAQRGRL
ncbi:MAG TPA: hypothetical protein VLX92_21360, partial [Kofleriaceae bacterium]|nr:hypothetical protein [Kofleriaceae bacterium]